MAMTKLPVLSQGAVRWKTSTGQAPGTFQTLGVCRGLPPGIIEVGPTPPASVSLFPFGTGSVGQTFQIRLVGFKPLANGFLQIPLYQGTATLGAATGSGGATVGPAEKMADDLTADPSVGAAGVTYVESQAGGVAGVSIDSRGCRLFGIDVGPGDAAAGNALLASDGAA